MRHHRPLTKKDALFARLVVEYGNLVRAYILAYDKADQPYGSARSMATRKAQNPNIAREIERQREALRDAMTITAEWVTSQHRGLYTESRDIGDSKAATANLVALGKTIALYTDNHNVQANLSDLSDDEIDRRVAEAVAEVKANAAARRKSAPPAHAAD